MHVYVLRHGEAGDAVPGKDDSRRPLTTIGIARMAQQAETLRRMRIPVDVLLSSPFLRARQTADSIAKAFGVQVEEDRRLQPGATPDVIAAVLNDYRDSKHVWITGHEPDLSTFVGVTIGGGIIQMRKGSLACIKIEGLRPLRGTLQWLATPELMGATEQ